MSYLIEVTDANSPQDKPAKILLNLDQIIKIYKSGQWCILQTPTEHLKVRESFEQFKQFAVHTVSAEDIQRIAGGLGKVSAGPAKEPLNEPNAIKSKVPVPTKKETAPVQDILPEVKPARKK